MEELHRYLYGKMTAFEIEDYEKNFGLNLPEGATRIVALYQRAQQLAANAETSEIGKEWGEIVDRLECAACLAVLKSHE